MARPRRRLRKRPAKRLLPPKQQSPPPRRARAVPVTCRSSRRCGRHREARISRLPSPTSLLLSPRRKPRRAQSRPQRFRPRLCPPPIRRQEPIPMPQAQRLQPLPPRRRQASRKPRPRISLRRSSRKQPRSRSPSCCGGRAGRTTGHAISGRTSVIAARGLRLPRVPMPAPRGRGPTGAGGRAASPSSTASATRGRPRVRRKAGARTARQKAAASVPTIRTDSRASARSDPRGSIRCRRSPSLRPCATNSRSKPWRKAASASTDGCSSLG